jgi:hypothetical protein
VPVDVVNAVVAEVEAYPLPVEKFRLESLVRGLNLFKLCKRFG